jgi:hypothetical protein
LSDKTAGYCKESARIAAAAAASRTRHGLDAGSRHLVAGSAKSIYRFAAGIVPTRRERMTTRKMSRKDINLAKRIEKAVIQEMKQLLDKKRPARKPAQKAARKATRVGKKPTKKATRKIIRKTAKKIVRKTASRIAKKAARRH